MVLTMSRQLFVVVSLSWAAVCAAAETASSTEASSDKSTSCDATGTIVGSVLGTFFATLILFGLIYLVYQRYFKKRRGKSKSTVNLTSVESNDDQRYAYDNPYFVDEGDAGGVGEGEGGRPATTLDTAQRGEAVIDGGKNASSLDNNKVLSTATAAKAKKGKSAKANLLSVLTTAKLGRHRALDDSCIHLEPEKLVVPLRGIDFTGLGFNVCGNMRDGIFIKDVLHRGPAMESGKIKAGDRILSLTVSFANMVYEDALTILSYASPYDVQVEIQKMSDTVAGHPHAHQGHQKKGSNSSNISNGASAIGIGGGRERLYHPLYRSQSIGDLSKIGKDDSPAKRSSSVGGAAMVKVAKKEPFVKLGQSFSEEGSIDVDVSNHNKTSAVNVTSSDAMMSSVESLDTLDAKPKASRFRVQKVLENEVHGESKGDGQVPNESDRHESIGTTLVVASAGAAQEDSLSSSSKSSSDEFENVELNDDPNQSQTVQTEQPIAAKRTGAAVDGKRRAPHPPSSTSDNDYGYADSSVGGTTTLQVNPDIHEIPQWVSDHSNLGAEVADSVAIQTNFSSDNDSTSSDDENSKSHNETNCKTKGKSMKIPLKELGAAADRRASSLGDLTSVEESNKKNFPLERSVSMDFNHAELIHGKLAMQQIEQLGPKMNENGTAGANVGSSDDELIRVNPLKTYFGATENLHLRTDNGANGHCNFLKSWDQVESLVHAGNDEEDEKERLESPIPRLTVVTNKEDEGDLWEVDVSEHEMSDELSSSLSDDSEEPRHLSKPAPLSKPPPPPPIKRMIAVDVSVDHNYDSSSSSSEDEEGDGQVNRQLVNVLDIPFVEGDAKETPWLRVQPTSYIHHDANTGSSTVTIGALQASSDKHTRDSTELDPEMAKIFNNVTVSNTSRDLFTLDIDSWIQNGAQLDKDKGFRNGNGQISPDVVKEQFETTLNFDLESPDGPMDKVGVISFESTPPGGNNVKTSSASNLTELGGVSRTIITSPQLASTTSEIQLIMDPPPSLQPPQ